MLVIGFILLSLGCGVLGGRLAMAQDNISVCDDNAGQMGEETTKQGITK